MSKLDDIYFDNNIEYYQKQQEQIDNAIAEFIKAMQGVSREELLNALKFIETESDTFCYVKVPTSS